MVHHRVLLVIILIVSLQALGAYATSAGDPVIVRQGSESPTPSPIVEIPKFRPDGSLHEAATAVPPICSPENVQAIFDAFVDRYNAGDLEGVLDVLQDEHPDWPYPGHVPHDESGEVAFQFLSMDHSDGDGFTADKGFTAATYDELRPELEERFRTGEQLRLKRVIITISMSHGTHESPGSFISKRNADVAVEFERWSPEWAVHTVAGSGSVDCQAGKIIQLGFGPGPLEM